MKPLKEWRMLKGLTQRELAENAGVSVMTIGHIERTELARQHQRTVTRVSDALDVSPNDVAEFSNEAKEIPVVIYSLVDPRDERIHYIGQTQRSLQKRMNSHWSIVDSRPQLRLSRWLRELRLEDQAPIMVVLETVDKTQANETERTWITRMWADGAPLKNSVHTIQRPLSEIEHARINKARYEAIERDRQIDRERRQVDAERRRSKLKHVRALTGLSQRSLARRWEISYSFIHLWESGKRDPPAWIESALDQLDVTQ